MSDFDEREYVHIFRLKWATEGKMPRLIIDGRTYDTSAAVRADLKEARRALSRLHIPAEIDMSPIGPTDHGPVLPSWREFRVGRRPQGCPRQARSGTAARPQPTVVRR